MDVWFLNFLSRHERPLLRIVNLILTRLESHAKERSEVQETSSNK